MVLSLFKSNRKIFKTLVKDDELNCFDDILVYIKELPEPESSMINEIITMMNMNMNDLQTSSRKPGNQRS